MIDMIMMMMMMMMMIISHTFGDGSFIITVISVCCDDVLVPAKVPIIMSELSGMNDGQ